MLPPALIAALLTTATPAPKDELVVKGHRDVRTDVQALFVEDTPEALDLGQVLEAGGASVSRKGSAGRAQFLTLRGTSSHQTAIFLDALPLNGATGAAFDLSELPIGLVDRLEIIRGPVSALYGSGAQGGALIIHTRKPRRPAWSARLSGGSWGFLQGQISRADGGDRWRLLTALSAQRAQGDFAFRDTNDTPQVRRNNQHRQFNGLVNGALTSDAGTFAALVEAFDGERGEPGDSGAPTTHRRSVRQRIQTGLSWQTDAQSATFSARTRHYSLAGGDVQLVDAPSRLQIDDQRFVAAWRGDLTRGAWRLGARTETRYEAATRSADGADTRSEQRGSGALVGLLGHTLGPLDLEWVNRLDAAQSQAPIWVPMGRARLAGRHLGAFASAGRAFRRPSFDELFFEGPGIRGNPDLRPEDGIGFELGGRWSTRRAEVGLTAFHTQFDRLIFFETTGAFQIEARDDAGATTRGLEADGRVDWRRLRLTAQYTALDAHFSHAPNNPLPLRPRHRVNGRAALRSSLGQVFLGGMWRGAVHADRLGHRQLPSRGTLDTGVLGPVFDDFELSLRVDNLLDAQGVDFVQRPLPGRSFRISLSFRTP